MVGQDRNPSIMQLGSCRSALSKGTLEGICTLVCRDQYRKQQARGTPAPPGKLSEGIVQDIQGRHQGVRDPVRVQFSSAPEDGRSNAYTCLMQE